jgi:hypothetical protein
VIDDLLICETQDSEEEEEEQWLRKVEAEIGQGRFLA